jgi:hypothetical protein
VLRCVLMMTGRNHPSRRSKGHRNRSLLLAPSTPDTCSLVIPRSREKSNEVLLRSTWASSEHNPSALWLDVGRLMQQGEITCFSFELRHYIKSHSNPVCQPCTNYYRLFLEHGRVQYLKRRRVLNDTFANSREINLEKKIRQCQGSASLLSAVLSMF